MNNEETLARIGELVTKRDNLKELERYFAGRANADGFRIGLWEKVGKRANDAEWIKAAMDPSALGAKLISSILERVRRERATSPGMKRLLLAIEAHLFWGKMACDLAKGLTPVSLAGAGASIVLKATKILSLSREEKLRISMMNCWEASEEFRRAVPAVVAELNAEIDALPLAS